MLAGVDVPGHSAALPIDAEDVDQAALEKIRLRRLACALPEVIRFKLYMRKCIFYCSQPQ